MEEEEGIEADETGWAVEEEEEEEEGGRSDGDSPVALKA